MRKYVFAICAAALCALPTSAAFSQIDVEVGPGGVHVGLVTIATTTIVTKAVVVAAENYEQLVCTRKNWVSKEWAIAADIVNSAAS